MHSLGRMPRTNSALESSGAEKVTDGFPGCSTQTSHPRGYLRSKILITPGTVFLSSFFHILLHIQWWCNRTDKLWINKLTELIPWIKSCHLSSWVTSWHDVFTSWGYGGEGCLLVITCDDNTKMHSTGARPQCSMSSSMNKLAMYCEAKGRHAPCNITTTALVIRAQHAPNLDCHHHFCNNTKAPAGSQMIKHNRISNHYNFTSTIPSSNSLYC